MLCMMVNELELFREKVREVWLVFWFPLGLAIRAELELSLRGEQKSDQT